MSQRKPISKIKKQIDALKEEQQEIKIFLERDKKKFSEELIKFKKEEIKNTIHEEENYTLWQRILRTLGMN
jgi:transcription antitermination factor NusA-like protein